MYFRAQANTRCPTFPHRLTCSLLGLDTRFPSCSGHAKPCGGQKPAPLPWNVQYPALFTRYLDARREAKPQSCSCAVLISSGALAAVPGPGAALRWLQQHPRSRGCRWDHVWLEKAGHEGGVVLWVWGDPALLPTDMLLSPGRGCRARRTDRVALFSHPKVKQGKK